MVFTGLLEEKKPGEHLYLTAGGDARGKEGYKLHRGRLPDRGLGKEIPFTDLPGGCRQKVLATYLELWGVGP